MNNIDKLERLVAEARADAEKLYEKDNKAAATRLRGTMQEIKKLAQEVRIHAIEKKNKIGAKR